jgi:hypothetical protein
MERIAIVPISEKQHAANRANAAKSTGPRTPEGKARSSQNSRTHGFTASTFAVVRLEELDEIAHLRQDLVAVYHPGNSQELFALEQMALAQQTMLRAARLESGLFTVCLESALNDNEVPFTPMSPALAGDGDIEITRAQNRNYALADCFQRLVQQGGSFTLLLRYKAQAERHYRRAVEEFERLRALRHELPNEAIIEFQPEGSGPPCIPPMEHAILPAAQTQLPGANTGAVIPAVARPRCGRSIRRRRSFAQSQPARRRLRSAFAVWPIQARSKSLGQILRATHSRALPSQTVSSRLQSKEPCTAF